MALLTANGLIVFDGQIRKPRVGTWHADLRIDSPDPLSGPVTIVVDDGAQTLVGTAIRSGEFVETSQARVVGGAGGLGLSATPRHYSGVTLGGVLADLLRDGGETMSVTADPAVLAKAIDAWTTAALPIGDVVSKVIQVAAPGSGWRILPDGTFWVGAESWPDAGLDPETYEVMDQAAEHSSMIVAFDRPMLEPGTTFEGRRVSYVQHDVPHNDPVLARVLFEDAETSDVGRMRAALSALVRGTPFDIDYRAKYWCKVIAQSGRTIEVLPEARGLPDMGQVALALPPGESADGVVGGRVLVGWPGGRGQGAVAELFDGGETVGVRTIAAGQLLLGSKTGAFPVLVLSPEAIIWLAAVGTGSTAGPPPPTMFTKITEAA